MKIEAADPTTDEKRMSFPESRMSRRRAISFLAVGALSAVAMLYFGFPSAPKVSAASYGSSSTSTSESSTTTQESSSSTTTTTQPGGGW